MMSLYLVSAVYHAAAARAIEALFQPSDHAAIFLFIAAATPRSCSGRCARLGLSLFGAVWGGAVVACREGLQPLGHPLWSTGLYVAMGWMAIVAVVPLVQRVAPGGLALLRRRRRAYTVGAIFFLLDNRVRYAHFVWHLFVMTGQRLPLLRPRSGTPEQLTPARVKGLNARKAAQLCQQPPRRRLLFGTGRALIRHEHELCLVSDRSPTSKAPSRVRTRCRSRRR